MQVNDAINIIQLTIEAVGMAEHKHFGKRFLALISLLRTVRQNIQLSLGHISFFPFVAGAAKGKFKPYY